MTQINDRELYVNRVNATSVQLYTDAGRTAALNSSGFDTYASSGVLEDLIILITLSKFSIVTDNPIKICALS